VVGSAPVSAAPAERLVAVAELGERLSALRLSDASALRAMRASLEQHGQLSPVRAFEQEGGVEIFDGFKRLRAARALGVGELRAVVSDIEAAEATVQMRELHAGRGLTALEEGWIVRALYRDHHLSQGAIAARLRRHKTWVCRRLMLVEALDASLQADLRLGLLTPRAAALVATLPRGNQPAAAAIVVHRGLTVHQTARLVHELGAAAAEPSATQAVLARWHQAGPPGERRRAPRMRSAAETIALDVETIRRSAGRLQASLAASPLAVMGLCGEALRDRLRALEPTLAALSKTIAGALDAAPAGRTTP
jgi:ParB/RepB/Spo0J family partition protein